MTMHFEELDDSTQTYMLRQFEAEEQSGQPYRGRRLTSTGRAAWPTLMRQAIVRGSEQSLIAALCQPLYWDLRETIRRNDTTYVRTSNLQQKAYWLGLTEFNVWYVRGLARKLLDERVPDCEIYRAQEPLGGKAEWCSVFEGRVVSTQAIYEGHRAHYWPPPGNPHALMVPFGPACHHTIRRVKYARTHG
jgi:hypothetical protein